VRRFEEKEDSKRKRQRIKAYTKLLGYPIILVLVYSIPTFHRISQHFISNQDYINVMSLIHAILSPLIGLFNVFLYFFNPMIGKNVLEYCDYYCMTCCRKSDELYKWKWIRLGTRSESAAERLFEEE